MHTLICRTIDLPFSKDKTYRFNILEQILFYIESVHNRYYFNVHLLRLMDFFDLQGQPLKYYFQTKRDSLLIIGILK